MGTRVDAIRETVAGGAACLTDAILEAGADTVAGVGAILGFLMVPWCGVMDRMGVAATPRFEEAEGTKGPRRTLAGALTGGAGGCAPDAVLVLFRFAFSFAPSTCSSNSSR